MAYVAVFARVSVACSNSGCTGESASHLATSAVLSCAGVMGIGSGAAPVGVDFSSDCPEERSAPKACDVPVRLI